MDPMKNLIKTILFFSCVQGLSLPATCKASNELNKKSNTVENSAQINSSNIEEKPIQQDLCFSLLALAFKNALQKSTCDTLLPEEILLLEEEAVSKTNKKIDAALMGFLVIPSSANIYFIGDLHGDYGPIKALMNQLTAEGKFDPKTNKLGPDEYVIFLGDYIDRGEENLEVITYLTSFLIDNPKQVFLLRGNHECWDMAKQPTSFLRLLEKDFTNQILAKEMIQNFLKAFGRMPVLLFIQHGNKKNRFVATHGGINPRIKKEHIALINEKLNQEKSCFWVMPKADASTYLWSDLKYNDETPFFPKPNTERNSYGFILYQNHVKDWLKKLNQKHLFRGHQQVNDFFTYINKIKSRYRLFTEGPLRGVGSWNDIVTVLNVAPNTGHYNNPSLFNKNDFFCEYGTLIKLSQKTKDSSENDSVLPSEKSKKCAILPGLTSLKIKPIHFDPVTHTILHQTGSSNSLMPHANAQPDKIME